jgi:outer membrane protein
MRLSDCVTALAVVCVVAGPAAATEQLTVDQAVELALKQNRRLLAVEKRAGAGHDAALATGAHLLPAVRLTEEYQHWDCAAALSLVAFAKGSECFETLAAATPPGMPPPVIARRQDTNNFVAAIDQPLVGLLHIGYDYAAARANAKAGDAGSLTARASIVQAVRSAFLQYFEARALEQIAAASVHELDEQVKVAQARLKAGVITNADLLRVQVAEANARQQQIAARTQGVVTRNNLLDGIGLAPGADVELSEPTTLLTAATQPLPAGADAVSSAEAHRPEVAQVDAGERAAGHSRTARYLSLLPEVDAEGAYVRTDGQLFAPPNQWFIGVRASWNIWEWGATFFQARAAGKQAAAAALDRDNQRRVVAVEVANALAQTEAAKVSVDVAHEAISSAQEAYRVENALLLAGSATTTDLLDAQSALTTARLNLARAQYELAIQRVALARVMGDQ